MLIDIILASWLIHASLNWTKNVLDSPFEMLDFEYFYSYNKKMTSKRRQSIRDKNSIIFSSGWDEIRRKKKYISEVSTKIKLKTIKTIPVL